MVEISHKCESEIESTFKCNYLTLRHGNNSTGVPIEDWLFQGSYDGNTWFNLLVQKQAAPFKKVVDC